MITRRALPDSLFQLALDIASETKVDVDDVLIEAARDGLEASRVRSLPALACDCLSKNNNQPKN